MDRPDDSFGGLGNYEFWQEQAEARNVTLPRADARWTASRANKFLKKLGLERYDWEKRTGEKLHEMSRLNIGMTLQEWCGITLERLYMGF